MRKPITLDYILGSTNYANPKGKYFFDENLGTYYKKIKSNSLKSQFLRSDFATVKFNSNFITGVYSEFYKTGNIHIEIPFVLEDGSYSVHGKEKVYYEGYDDVSMRIVYTLLSEREFTKGFSNGLQKEYYTNGLLMSESFYELQETIHAFSVNFVYFKKHNLNGQIIVETYSERGKEYYENGQIKLEWRKNTNGNMEFENRYYPDGKIKSVFYYESGLLTKKDIYDKTGKLNSILIKR